MLQQLIADILDLSKIEAGTLEFVFSDVDINQMMSDLEQQFRMRVAELGSGVQIVREASEKEYTMHTDRNRLAQVVSNFYDECPEVHPGRQYYPRIQTL